MQKLDATNLRKSVDDNIQPINQKRIVVTAVCILTIIIIYMQSQKMKMVFITPRIYNDTSFNKFPNQTYSFLLRREFDVVLSYYGEDVTVVARFIQYLRNVSTLQKLKLRIIVYNKNPKIHSTYLKTVLNADIVQPLPNVGREGATYLYHIIDNYDTLANHTLFSQAAAHGISDTGLADWFLHRLEKQFNFTVGYMPLVHTNAFTIFDCGERPHDNVPRLADLWGMLEQTVCPPDKQFVAFTGQFLVSAKRIRNRPLRVYKYINDLITANSTHWIHQDRRGPALHSTPDNPSFGHTLERLWTTLFSCTKIDIIDRCDKNECACFDSL